MVFDFLGYADEHCRSSSCFARKISHFHSNEFPKTAAGTAGLNYNSNYCMNNRMKYEELDKIDKIILAELQKNARQSINELAAKAGLSASSCHRRVKLLEEAGTIVRYTATLDRTALGLANEFFVEVSLSAQTEEA